MKPLPWLLCLAAAAGAEDVINAPTGALRTGAAPGATASGETRSNHSWELPALQVQSTGLREEDRVGSYGQPRWTARRRFTEVRSYVIPEGQIEFEYWLIAKDFEKDQPTEIQQVYELEMGLPHRFQLDLYQVWAKQGDTGSTELDETKFELRWALADWGRIWANPTLYGEWAQKNAGNDAIEGKLLLSDELAPKWHWAANLVYEREVGGEQTIAREFCPGISYTVVDEKLSVGAEGKFAWEDKKGARGRYEREFLLGPSVQLRPQPQMHVDLAYLPQLYHDSTENAKFTAIIGWEF